MQWGSLRLKIIISHMALLTLLMLCFSIVLYDRLLGDLSTNLDNLLQSRAQGIAEAIDTYWEIEQREAQHDGISPTRLSKTNNPNFIKIAQRWVIEESNRPDLLDIIVQISDSTGTVIASSPNISQRLIFPKDIFQDALNGRSRFDTVKAPFSSHAPTMLRVFTKPVSENATVVYIVQVASPMTSIHNALADLKTILMVLLPLTIVCTGLIGYALATVTLRPIAAMIKSVQQITARNLKLRVPVPRSRDEIHDLAVTFNDMLARLEQSFDTQRQFVQDASHELKTPLTILEGEISVALKKPRTPEEYESVLKSCLEEIERLNMIVGNLLMLARLEDRAMVAERQPCDIGQMLADIVADMEVLASQKQVRLAYVPTPGLMVTGIPEYLRRVFVNLIDNAIKYSFPEGTVTITAYRSGGSITVTVHDTGCGIPEQDLPHIFDRFYRVDKARATGGFGLGLSIARSIVGAHNGTISATSSPEQGTTFTVSIPEH
ncbi:MAG: ATP-binding protein [Desulfobacterota bacterium]|nr:ATP-binding protein [Thermodesulfobacteriota bacterium]